MSRNRELFQNSIIFGFGIFGAKLIKFFLLPLYTIYMTAEQYSTADIVATSASLVSPLLMMGLENGVLRFVINQEKNRQTVLKFSLTVCCAGVFVLSALIPIWNRISVFEHYGYMMPLLYGCGSIKHILANYCKAIEKNITYASDGIFSALSLTVCNFIMLSVFQMGIFGYLISIVLSNLISIIYLAVTCQVHRILYHAMIDWGLVKELLFFSFPLVWNELSWWVIQTSDRYMVAYICGDRLNGIYSMAYKIPAIFNLLVGIFNAAFGITAIKESDMSVPKEGKHNGTYFEKIFKQYIFVTFLFAAIIILCSRLFALFFLKKSFYEAWVYIPLLVCSYAIGNLQSFYSNIFMGIKKTKWISMAAFLGAVTNILLNLWWIPKYQAYGAAAATISSYFVVYIVMLIGMRKNLFMNQMEGKIILSILLIMLMSIIYIKWGRYLWVWETILLGVLLILYKNEIRESRYRIMHLKEKLKK